MPQKSQEFRPVRVGLIGCGVIGRHHARAAKASAAVEFLAAADLIEERVRAVADEHQVPRTYPSGAALLKDPDVEAVVLAMPAEARCDLALKAFGAGKHVLTEKPVARSADEVKRMLAARGDRVAACCSMRYRSFASARAAAECVRRGDLGGLRVIRFRGIGHDRGAPAKAPPPWRQSHAQNGGGIFVNWGSYDLDYVLGIVGWQVRPRLALAQCWPIAPHLRDRVAPGSDADSHTIALVLCDDGIVLSLERAEYASLAGESAWQIIGDRGALRLNMTDAKGRQIVLDQTSATEPLKSTAIWSEPEDEKLVHSTPVDDFARAIRENRPPVTPLDKALVMQQITDAVYASAREGRAVEIE